MPIHTAHCAGLLMSLVWVCTTPYACAVEPSTAHSRFAGSYFSRGDDGGKYGPAMNLSLGRDGTATVTEEFSEGTETLFGHWTDGGSQVTVTFDRVEGQRREAPMVFQLAHDGLQAVTWNHEAWSEKQPPPMKKGYRVKQLYWLTTNP